MKIKIMISLACLVVACGLQIRCSPHATKIEKVIIERQVSSVSDKNLIH